MRWEWWRLTDLELFLPIPEDLLELRAHRDAHVHLGQPLPRRLRRQREVVDEAGDDLIVAELRGAHAADPDHEQPPTPHREIPALKRTDSSAEAEKKEAEKNMKLWWSTKHKLSGVVPEHDIVLALQLTKRDSKGDYSA
eukprot:COSAG06_NODE_26963_length_604_cov_0.617822_1_plen_138_part_10